MRLPIKKIFRAVLLICFLQTTVLFGQEKALPPFGFVLKASTYPIIFCFARTNHADLGYELRISDNWSYGGFAGISYPSPFFQSTTDYHAYLFGQEFRRYKTDSKWFLGANLFYRHSNSYKTYSDWDFPFIEGFEVYQIEKSFGGHAIGGYEMPLGQSNFLLDFSGGLGIVHVSTEFQDLTQAELEQMYDINNWTLSTDGIRRRMQLSFHLAINIGFAFRK